MILDVDDPNKKLITLEIKSSIDQLDDNELFARFQHSSDKPVGSSEDTTTLLLEAKGKLNIRILLLIIINHMIFYESANHVHKNEFNYALLFDRHT